MQATVFSLQREGLNWCFRSTPLSSLLEIVFRLNDLSPSVLHLYWRTQLGTLKQENALSVRGIVVILLLLLPLRGEVGEQAQGEEGPQQ